MISYKRDRKTAMMVKETRYGRRNTRLIQEAQSRLGVYCYTNQLDIYTTLHRGKGRTGDKNSYYLNSYYVPLILKQSIFQMRKLELREVK